MPTPKARVTLVNAALAPAMRATVKARIASLVAELHPTPAGGAPRKAGFEQLATLLPTLDSAGLWLAIAVVRGELPRTTQVRRLRRILELDTGWHGVDYLLGHLPNGTNLRVRPKAVAITSGVTLVDVTGLFRGSDAAEGRGVGRQLLREWTKTKSFLPVTWHDDERSLRGLTRDERQRLGIADVAGDDDSLAETAVVPHNGRFVLLGRVEVPRSAERLVALGEYSGNRTGSVGYGIGELVEAERYEPREGTARFSWHLAAQRSFHVLVGIGEDTRSQYSGWRRMLSAVGIAGPSLTVLPLPQLQTDTGVITVDPLARTPWTELADQCADALLLG